MELRKIENSHKPDNSRDQLHQQLQGAGSSLTSSSLTSSVDSDRLAAICAESLEETIVSLCHELQHFSTARISTIRFYEQLQATSANKQVAYPYEELIRTVNKIVEKFCNAVHHPILDMLRSSFVLECEIISHLLQCHIDIQNNKFLPSLSHLKEAKLKLDEVTEFFSSSETKKATANTKAGPPELFDWLILYKNALFSKYSLYFFEVFIQQSTLADVRTTMSKTSIDYYTKITQFYRKTDALSVCFVLNTNELPEPYEGPGYHLPPVLTSVPPVSPTGLDSYPAIFCYPPEKPDKQWPAVVSILTSRSQELSVADRVISFYDERVHTTYFMVQTDPQVTLVAVYESKKMAKDSVIIGFLTAISADLRCTRIFASLKPGSK